MAKSVTIRARVEPSLKEEGDSVLQQLGLSTSDFISMTYRQLVMHRGLPFVAKIPNAETLAALEASRVAHGAGEHETYDGPNAFDNMVADIVGESD